MNIFILDPDPAVAASYHCDQHLSKMILESAQMLSTALVSWHPHLAPFVYKPTHVNHPCTKWVCASKTNAWWVVNLMQELDILRQSLGSDFHKSMEIASVFKDVSYEEWLSYKLDDFIFCGPADIANSPNLPTVPDKYKQFYRIKWWEWNITPRPMTYKNRPIPDFMKDLIS